MTENNTAPAGAIYGVTAEDLTAHRAKLEADRAEAYQLWLTLPSGADEQANFWQGRDLVEAWDNMSTDEQAEAIRDERTKAATPAEPEEEATEAQRLATALGILADRPNQNAKSTLTESARVLLELEIAHRQQVEQANFWQGRATELGKQIEGDDHRLTDFWEKAGELADRHNFCEQFDILSEALGGPGREVEGYIEVTVQATISVPATMRRRDSESRSEVLDYVNYNVDISDFLDNAQFEIEEIGDFCED